MPGLRQAAPPSGAPFVCFSQDSTEGRAVPEQVLSTYEEAMALGMSTREAVDKGFAILDGGATKSLGSAYAVEKVMALNLDKHGSSKLAQVDVKNTPMSFANSSDNKCCSTIQLGLEDQGTGPVLLSVSTLRSLGALVDFENELVI